MNLQLTKQTLSISGHDISVEFPSSQDQLLEQTLFSEDPATCDADPYWGLLWDAAPKTAAMILRHEWPAPLNVLDLGCGVGLTGIAALQAGHAVTFADQSTLAIEMAISNATLNGFRDTPGLVFEWKHPPAARFDLIIASDVLYDVAAHVPLLSTLQSMLSGHGVAWIGDTGRTNAMRFAKLAFENGWDLQTFNEHAEACPEPAHLQFRLLVLSCRCPQQHDVRNNTVSGMVASTSVTRRTPVC